MRRMSKSSSILPAAAAIMAASSAGSSGRSTASLQRRGTIRRRTLPVTSRLHQLVLAAAHVDAALQARLVDAALAVALGAAAHEDALDAADLAGEAPVQPAGDVLERGHLKAG